MGRKNKYPPKSAVPAVVSAAPTIEPPVRRRRVSVGEVAGVVLLSCIAFVAVVPRVVGESMTWYALNGDGAETSRFFLIDGILRQANRPPIGVYATMYELAVCLGFISFAVLAFFVSQKSSAARSDGSGGEIGAVFDLILFCVWLIAAAIGIGSLLALGYSLTILSNQSRGTAGMVWSQFVDGDVVATRFSPDGKQFMVRTEQGVTKAWNIGASIKPTPPTLPIVEKSKELKSTKLVDGRVLKVDSTKPTSVILSKASGEELRRYRRDEGHEVVALINNKGSDRFLTIDSFNDICSWDLESGNLISHFRAAEFLKECSPVLSASGTRLAARTGTYQTTVWDVASGREIATFGEVHLTGGRPLTHLEFAHDERYLLIAWKNDVKLVMLRDK